MSKFSISHFLTSWVNKICIHQCFRYNAHWKLIFEGSKLYTDVESGEKKLNQQEMMTMLIHTIGTYCNCGWPMLIGNLSFQDI